MRKKNEAGGIRPPVFRLYYKDTVIKQYGTGTKPNMDQWNRIESPETNLCAYGKLNYNKGSKNIQCSSPVLSALLIDKTGFSTLYVLASLVVV